MTARHVLFGFAGVYFALNAAPLPCTIPDNGWRVATPSLVYVNCSRPFQEFETTGKLFVGRRGQRKEESGVTVSVKLYNKSRSWLELRPVKEGKPFPLTASRDYEIDLAADGQAKVVQSGKPVAGPFDPMTFEFSTRPVARVETGLRNTLGAEFQVRSNLALRPFDPNEPVFAEIGLLKNEIGHESRSESRGTLVTECMAAGTCPEPQPRLDTPETYGLVVVTLTEDLLRQAEARVRVTGLKDVFGQPLRAESKVTLGGVPKTKDDSDYYFKFSHQAGPGARPGWVADVKFAPDIGRVRLAGFYMKPVITLDVGEGTVERVKTNNMITAGLGLTRIFAIHGNGFESVRLTPGVSFETNKERNKQNLLYDQELQVNLTGLYRPRKVRARRMFLKEPGKYTGYSEKIARYGYGVQLFGGLEIGDALVDRSVKASRSEAKVTVPRYTVARVRPRVRAFLEAGIFTWEFLGIPRYLMADENLTREMADGRSIRVAPTSGWRPYGEASMSIGLDRSGHVALSSTYKLGSQPPNFVKADTVQTGLLLRY